MKHWIASLALLAAGTVQAAEQGEIPLNPALKDPLFYLGPLLFMNASFK